MRERIRQIIDYKGLSLPELEAVTGISAYKWGNLLTGKQRVNEDHINALVKLCPEFAYWLTTGETLPNAGQVSPEQEKARRDSARDGTHG